MRVRISGNTYDTAELPVGFLGVEQEPPVIRDVGVQLRRNLQNATRYVYNGWFRMGVGWNRADRGTGRGVGGLRDSTAETRFRVAELGILNEAQTHTSPADHIRKYVGPFKGDFFGFFEEDFNAGIITDTVCRVWAPDAWTGGGTIESGDANSRGQRLWDAIVHEGRMWAATTSDDDDGGNASISIARSTDGATWEETGTTTQVHFNGPTTAEHRGNNFDVDGARLLSFGSTLMIAVDDSVDSTVNVHFSTDPEAVSPTFSAGAVIPSGSGPKAFVRWYGLNSSGVWVDSPVLVTAEGVYRVDSAGTTFDLIYPLDGDPNTGRWAAVSDNGDLWLGIGSGDVIALSVPVNGSGPITRRRIGPPGDGFVAARQGHANFILAKTGLPWNFIACGGHVSGETASIWAVDLDPSIDPETGKLFHVWHSMYSEADANIDAVVAGYSSEDDQTPRLHFGLENDASSEMFHLERPDVSGAASGVSIKRQSSSIMEFAEEDFDDPHGSTTVLRSRLEADDLSAGSPGDEFVEHEYGVDGAAYTAVSDFGNYVSGDKQLEFGRTEQNTAGAEAGNPEGVAALTLRSRLALNRGSTNTNGPKIKELEIQAINQVDDLLKFIVPIDLEATSQLTDEEQRDARQVLDEIITIIRSGILVPFEIGGRDLIFVKCRMLQLAELTSREISLQYDTEELRGKTILVCEEALR